MINNISGFRNINLALYVNKTIISLYLQIKIISVYKIYLK